MSHLSKQGGVKQDTLKDANKGDKKFASFQSLQSLFNSKPSKMKTNSPDSFQMVEFPNSADQKGSSVFSNKGYQMGRPALVRKGGQYRISYKGLGSKGKRFAQDMFQTLIDMKWRWVIMMLFLVFFLAYLVFAILWYLLALAHGDFDHLGDPNWKPCVINLRNFADCLLFSIETQTTIGFGTLYPDPYCVGSVPLVYLQVTIGFLIETLLLGFILVKVARPKSRRNTLMYSSVACICREEGHLVFQVRLGDMRQTHLIDAKAYGIFIKDKLSEEGIHYPLYQHYMDIQAHGMDDRVFLVWPLVLNHRITEDSPLWGMKPEEILHSNTFEVVIVLEGTIESTGEICQARTSYTSKDILWGYRFANIVEFDHEHAQWRANFKLFDDVIPSQTPKCSAFQLDYLAGDRDVKDYVEKPHLRNAYSHKESLHIPHYEEEEEEENKQQATKNGHSIVEKLKASLAEDRF